MDYSFESCFANRIIDFINQKKAIGFPYLESSRILHNFDRFCKDLFPEEDSLTDKICLAWAVKKDSEGNNTFRNRLMPIREFGRYLNRIGENAYVLSPDFAKKVRPHAPYIYTENEICSIWEVLDHINRCKCSPVRHLVYPAMIKIMYCCGLRPGEAVRLRTRDVDLTKGRINIIESKQHKSRIVMLADDVKQMLVVYDVEISKEIPGRSYFFPTKHDSCYSKAGLLKMYRKVLKKANIIPIGRRRPRLYDFRHTFATHRLYYWMREGKDLNVMLPYLSAYMGHAQLSDTYYYIHLVPGIFEEISGFDFSSAEKIIPEVKIYE